MILWDTNSFNMIKYNEKLPYDVTVSKFPINMTQMFPVCTKTSLCIDTQEAPAGSSALIWFHQMRSEAAVSVHVGIPTVDKAFTA